MFFRLTLISLLFVFSSKIFASNEQSPTDCAGQMTIEADSIFAPFPNPNRARSEHYFYNYGEERMAIGMKGYLTNSVPFTVDNVIHGYRHSIFPFIEEHGRMHWFSLPNRGVIDFKDFNLSRKTKKFLKKANYTVTMNHDFRGAILACSDSSQTINAATRGGDWINDDIIKMYTNLHKMGYAHSVEVWAHENGQKVLAGAAYGVLIDGVFFGESMVTRRDEGGRLAVAKLVEFLKSKGFTWMDLQMVTPTTKKLGAKSIPRDEFIQRLRGEQVHPLYFPVEKLELDPNVQ